MRPPLSIKPESNSQVQGLQARHTDTDKLDAPATIGTNWLKLKEKALRVSQLKGARNTVNRTPGFIPKSRPNQIQKPMIGMILKTVFTDICYYRITVKYDENVRRVF